MKDLDFVTVDELYDLKDNTSLNQKDHQIIELLLEAITDWPRETKTVNHFLNEVKIFLKTDALTFEVINKGIKERNSAEFAWELESLSSLEELMKSERDQTLDLIMKKITLAD